MGAFLFLLAGIYAAATLFLEKEKWPLVAAKRSISNSYLALQKTSAYDLIYMPIYRENIPSR